MEDIIWYLHRFVLPKQYSLLNKKCRKTYFEKEGVTIDNYVQGKTHNMYEKWQYEFLLKYKICLRIIYTDYPETKIYGVNHPCNNEYTGRIMNNIVSIESERLISSYILALMKKLPNLKYISGRLILESMDQVNLISKYNIAWGTYATILVYRGLEEIKNMAKLLTKIGIKSYIALSWCNINDPSSFRSLVQILFDHDDVTGDFPELLEMRDLEEVPNITAPKLNRISARDIIIAYKTIKKYGTITEFLDGTQFKFLDSPEFAEAYNYLTDYRFDISINIEDLPKLLKLKISDKFIRKISVYNSGNSTILEEAEKIFYVEVIN